MFTPHFEQVKPVIYTNLPSYNLIKHAKSNTSLGLLNERLKRDTNTLLLNVNFDDLNNILSIALSVLEGIQKGQLCLAPIKDLAIMLQMGVCAYKPELVKKMYHSKPLAQGLMTGYQKALPAHIIRYIDYKGRTLHEMAIVGHLQCSTTFNAVAPGRKMQEPLNWEFFKCFYHITDEERGFEVANRILLGLDATGNIFMCGFYAVG